MINIPYFEFAPILAIALPLLGGFFSPIINLIAERIEKPKLRDGFALVISLLTLGVVIDVALKALGGEILVYQLAGRAPPFGINLAVDGLAALVGLAAAGLSVLVIIYSISFMERETGIGKYYTLILILTAGMMGVAFTGDIFNLYVFFEVMSIPSYGLVAFYKSGKSVEASIKYLVIATLGTTSILFGIALVYGLAGTLNIADLAVRLSAFGSQLPSLGIIALILFITGFGIKIGMAPLHAWLPDAYQSAPSSISAILAGGTTIVGVGALLRVSYLLFGATFSVGKVFIALGIITMILGAFMALVQSDLKRLLAYSGISQMGYVLMAVGLGTLNPSTFGIEAGLFHMFNNVIYKSLLFLCAGAVVYRVGTSKLEELGGLGSQMPITAIIFMIGALALAGIPPFNGFASKWMIYLTGIQAGFPILTVVAVIISALTLAYLLKAFSMVFLGTTPKNVSKLKEAPSSMIFPMAVLAALCVIFGILPEMGISITDSAQKVLLNHSHYVKEVLQAAAEVGPAV